MKTEGWGTWLDIEGDQISRMVNSRQTDLAGVFLKLNNAETNIKTQKSEPLRSGFTGTRETFGQGDYLCH